MEKYIKTIKEWQPKILEQAEVFQKEMHSAAEEIMSGNPNVSYQDAVNTFLVLRISQVQFELNKLWAGQPSILDQIEREEF